MQDHLHGRYHLTPSQLYSVIRTTKSGTELEVPLPGDWVTIGVLADKSDIRTTTPVAAAIKEEVEEGADGETAAPKRSQKAKKFISFKLLDLRHKNAGGGDGIVNLFLFESDSMREFDLGLPDDAEEETRPNGVRFRREVAKGKVFQKAFNGGSGGAYEKFWKEIDGTVVAILNPKIMKPRVVCSKAHSSKLCSSLIF